MLELGVLIGGATVLALIVVSPIFRQPVPPRWTQSSLISETVTVALVAGFALGIILTGAGIIEVLKSGIGIVELGLLAGVAALLVVAWRRFRPGRITPPGSGRLPTGTA